MMPFSWELAESEDDAFDVVYGVMNALALSLGTYASLAILWLLFR